MKTIISLILIALASCAPKAITVEPIAPQVAKAHGEVRAAAEGAKRVQTKVTVTHTQAQSLATEAIRMKEETERLRKLPGVPLDEFDALWTMVTQHQRETFAHEIHTRDTVETAAEAEKLNAVAENSMNDLGDSAVKTDKGVSDLKTQIVKQADDASLGRALKTWIWMAVIVGTLGLILLLVIKLKPGIL